MQKLQHRKPQARFLFILKAHKNLSEATVVLKADLVLGEIEKLIFLASCRDSLAIAPDAGAAMEKVRYHERPSVPQEVERLKLMYETAIAGSAASADMPRESSLDPCILCGKPDAVTCPVCLTSLHQKCAPEVMRYAKSHQLDGDAKSAGGPQSVAGCFFQNQLCILCANSCNFTVA